MNCTLEKILRIAHWKKESGSHSLAHYLLLLPIYNIRVTETRFRICCGLLNPSVSDGPSLFSGPVCLILSKFLSLFQRSFWGLPVITHLCLIQFLGFRHLAHPNHPDLHEPTPILSPFTSPISLFRGFLGLLACCSASTLNVILLGCGMWRF